VSVKPTLSAGELFDFIRPAVLVASALISTWVLVRARRRYHFWSSLLWALGTLLSPLVVIPLFLAACWFGSNSRDEPARGPNKLTLALIYSVVTLLAIGAYLYLDSRTVDAHLARAAQARIKGNRGKAIAEYRAALTKEDNPHTHKLLAIELADAGDRTTAIQEFRRAEAEGETDETIPYRIGELLYSLNQAAEADLEYRKFLNSTACTQSPGDVRCEKAVSRVTGK